jgi:hypothetical protein
VRVNVLGARVAGVIGLGSAREVRLVIRVVGEGEFVSGPLFKLVGRCIVGGFAFFL